jgi:hypothetical protein
MNDTTQGFSFESNRHNHKYHVPTIYSQGMISSCRVSLSLTLEEKFGGKYASDGT